MILSCFSVLMLGKVFYEFFSHSKTNYFSFRNGFNVEGSTHKQVVDFIRSGGDSLTLTGDILNSFVLLKTINGNIFLLVFYTYDVLRILFLI